MDERKYRHVEMAEGMLMLKRKAMKKNKDWRSLESGVRNNVQIDVKSITIRKS